MSTHFIHTVIFVLLLSLTAHEVHAAIAHDAESCDACIHIQSNDDTLTDNSPQYVLLDMAFHLKIKVELNAFKSNFSQSADCIRGPPTFS